MLTLTGRGYRNCEGQTRRDVLRAGVLGLTGLGLADLLRIEAQARSVGRPTPNDLSVILVWLDGGPPQHETYDPKPEAPAEFRGPLHAIDSAVPGIAVSELMPKHARMMDKMAVIRSMHHNNGDHFAAAHWMLTGYLGANAVSLGSTHPSFGSVIGKLKGARAAGLPAYVGLPQTHSIGLSPGYHGSAYLGVAYNPFSADGDPNNDGYRVPNLAPPAGIDQPRAADRRALLDAFDHLRRDVDSSGLVEGLDRFRAQAYEMVTGPAARAAFDIRKEDPRLRDQYGRNTWGQSALLARRLVEAGVRFVTLTYGGWDMHSSLEKSVRRAVPMLDSAVGTLVADLDQRGLLESTIVLVMGEFGRTPRINKQGVPGSDSTPGRDHWGEVMSVLVAGGGLKVGQAIGASNARGETPKDRPLLPIDLIATLYKRLGIDPDATFVNNAGRPISLAGTGRVIDELLA